MMLEQVILTTLVLGWLFRRLSRRDEERQALPDWAGRHGVPLEPERAARAPGAGSTARLRQRMLEQGQASKSPDAIN